MLTKRMIPMAKKRIRIDIEDAEGVKYDIKLEGNITKDKVLKMFDMMNMIDIEEEQETPRFDSVNAKIWHVVDKYYQTQKFTSSDILERYEDEYNEPITHSVISTYLSRFSNKGRVQRNKTGKAWTYQTVKTNLPATGR